MEKYYNGSDALVYDKDIKAKDENDALITILKNDIIIYDGDTIMIEETE